VSTSISNTRVKSSAQVAWNAGFWRAVDEVPWRPPRIRLGRVFQRYLPGELEFGRRASRGEESGRAVLIDPDLTLVPTGGFNPSSNPPGRPTPLTADNSFYVRQIDTVVRYSRAVTIWINTSLAAPRYVEPVIEPRTQIGASALVFEYRGADTIGDDAGNAPFDAARLDPYGDFRPGTIVHHGDGTWSEDIRSVSGGRYLQVRFTFVNDTANVLSAVLDSLGIAFEV